MTEKTCFHVVRFTLEALSPVMIASGDDDPLFDNLLARDANGIPMIPASALAGTLRARMDEDRADKVFGFQTPSDGQRSAVTITDALMHWQDNQPRDGMAALDHQDPILELVTRDSPVTRQHVRLNEQGVTAGTGKFERSAVPAGARFTFEINAWHNDGAIDELAAQVTESLFLGGATRSGYGALKCIATGRQCYDLKGNGRESYLRYAESTLGETGIVELLNVAPPNDTGPHWLASGEIEGPFLIGAPREDRGGRKPFEEQQIVWDQSNNATLQTRTVLPGSAIKGPLRHRTLFHLIRRGMKCEDAEACLDHVFGSPAKDNSGRAGQLRFYEAEIDGENEIEVAHVSIDRFTGGARQGALFADRMLWQPKVKFRIDLLAPFPFTEIATAFDAALDDLKNGLLGIGAEWGEGAGIFANLDITEPVKGVS